VKLPIIFSKDKVHEPLFLVVPYFNPWRHKTRVKHTQRALEHFHNSGAVIYLVEVGFNRRDLIFADSGLHGTVANCGVSGEFRHRYISLNTKDELWLKECAINVGVQHLSMDHPNWQQVCWADSDVVWVRPNWVGEAVHLLQHGGASDMAFLQMFSQARDLSPTYEMMPEEYPHANGISFVQAWKRGILKSTITPQIQADLNAMGDGISQLQAELEKLKTDLNPEPYGQPHIFPGLAWACTRPAWDAMGGLIDYAIWGGGDWHMARALAGIKEHMVRKDLHQSYRAQVDEWYQRAEKFIRRNVLVMNGAIFHNWHGRKTERGYAIKHRLLAKIGFNPTAHLKKNAHGLWQLHDDGSEVYPRLRDTLRQIAGERDEDNSDTRILPSGLGH
jgi:hypothetical protein